MKFSTFSLLFWLSVGMLWAQKINDKEVHPKIQVALLLDTSNSMDGLLRQAAHRFWDIINTFTLLEYEQDKPQLQISVFEYGNDNIAHRQGYVRKILGFTHDIDSVSQALFSLKTKGGSEYCGTAIQKAVRQLDWSADSLSLKIMFIAGNEPFNQGAIRFDNAISEAREKQIQLHALYCGTEEKGIKEYWKTAAKIGEGQFFFFDHEQKIKYESTPFDNKIIALNDSLNSTYLPFGDLGKNRKKIQLAEDKNAQNVSDANLVNRIIAKTSIYYQHNQWDAVDAFYSKVGWDSLMKLDKTTQYKSEKELLKEILKLKNQRDSTQDKIKKLAQKRKKYLQRYHSNAVATQDDFGKAVIQAITDYALEKGYKIK